MNSLLEVDFSRLELLIDEALKDESKPRPLGSVTGRLYRYEPSMRFK